MNQALTELVWARAGGRCEYCQIAQSDDPPTFEIDHIFPLVHGGPTEARNLALTCWLCNCYKGPNLAGLEAERRVVRLFHPRIHRWPSHFIWDGPILMGRTAVGRVTIAVLRINLAARIKQRAGLIAEGLFPPT